MRAAFAILANERNAGNSLLPRVAERVREKQKVKDYYAQKTWEAVEKLLLSRSEEKYLRDDHLRIIEDISSLPPVSPPWERSRRPPGRSGRPGCGTLLPKPISARSSICAFPSRSPRKTSKPSRISCWNSARSPHHRSSTGCCSNPRLPAPGSSAGHTVN